MTEEPAEQEELFQDAMVKLMKEMADALKSIHACLEEIKEKM